MAIEPVNERPIFPSLTRPDAVGVSSWSTGMIRQLTTVFQQYGYKLNRTLTDEDLTQNDGTVPETDQSNVFTEEQVFWSTGGGSDSANGFRLYNETADVAWIFRKDQSSLFLLRSDTDETGDNWDDYRPLRFDDVTGGIRLNFGTGATEGVMIGGPSGGFRGQGTLNAEAVYDDNTLLTDYVFDAELDGRIDVAAYDRSAESDELDEAGKVIGRRKRTHRPAWAFAANMDETNPSSYRAKWRQSRKLPAIERIEGKPSIGQLVQALVETCEVQAVHIAKLEERISALEANNGSTEDAQPRRATDTRD